MPSPRIPMPAHRLTRRQVLAGMAAASLAPAAAARPVTATDPHGDLNQWIDSFGPGVHELRHVPTFAEYKLRRQDPRFPDALYAKAVETAWGRVGPSLGAWCGGAFRFPHFYTCTGGHADSGLDAIYRVNMVTGAVAVTRPSPLVRPHRTKRGTVMLPERDDYLQGHTYSSILVVEDERLWIGHWPLFSTRAEYFDDEFPVAWEVDFADQDENNYPRRRPLPHRYVSGAYLHLPDGNIFVGRHDAYGIADRAGRMLREEKGRFGWNACFSPARNAVYGLEYKGQVVELSLADGAMAKRWVIQHSRDARWIYGAGIQPFEDRLVIFTGGESYYLLDPATGLFKEYANDVFREKTESRCFNRFIRLRDRVYLYVPTDQNAHPLLWVG